MRLKHYLISYLLVVLLLLNLVYVFSGALHYPLAHVDVWSIWLFKAKAIFLENGVSLSFLRNSNYRFMHPQYPLLLPLLVSGLYFLLGEVNEVAVSLFYPLIYAAVIIFSYRMLIRLGYSVKRALLFTYLYSMLSPLLAQGGRFHAGMADIVLTLLYWVAVYLIFSIYKSGRSKHVLWLVVVVMVASQIKIEGMFLVSILLFIPIKWQRRLLVVFIAIVPFLLWWLARIYFAIPSSYGLHIQSPLIIMSRITTALFDALSEMIFNIKNWYIFWILLWFSMLIVRAKDKFVRKVIQPLALLFALFIAAIYGLSTAEIDGYVQSSLDRLLLQVSPFWFLLFTDRANQILSQSAFLKRLRVFHQFLIE